MSAPDGQAPGFQPDAPFAVAAQQSEIERLRRENGAQADRIVWLDACLRQFNEQANEEIARLTAENSQLKAKVESESTHGKVTVVNDPPEPEPIWAGQEPEPAGG